MGKRKVHVMNYKCCEGCINRPESLYKKCRYGWNVFGGSVEGAMCIFKRTRVEQESPVIDEDLLNDYKEFIMYNRIFYRRALFLFETVIKKGDEDIVLDDVEFKHENIIISYSNVETEKRDYKKFSLDEFLKKE